MKTDLEIAREAEMERIQEIAARIGVSADELELYGPYKAKISEAAYEARKERPDGKLILVTAVNPTPAGEGKTTTTVGLSDALTSMGKKVVTALREPSLGPVMGVKGGAAGGGYAQVVPMEDINLHFTGDMHAITAANNLLCAMLDNHIQQGNTLGIDPRTVQMPRVLDMNDRALRNVVIGLGGPLSGIPREDKFMITVASEVMAILCLCTGLSDLKERLARILVAYTYDKRPVYAGDLNAQGAMATLLKDAVKPNLVQTLEHTPCLMHGGPFANIAHGCNSILATRLALKLGDYIVTEAGFGADLGAEKFLNIKCRYGNLSPSAVVLVATVRALKYNGYVPKDKLQSENMEALEKGVANLKAHIENLRKFGVPVVVAVNRFASDTDRELAFVADYVKSLGARCAVCEVFAKGGAGGVQLAEQVLEACEEPSEYHPLYELDLSVEEKVETVVREIYGGDGVSYSPQARKEIERIKEMGYGNLPVCMAKTQYSFSADPTRLGAPKGFEIDVTDVKLRLGAGFIVVYTGSIMTMPGLPKVPAAEAIDIDDEGCITGLF